MSLLSGGNGGFGNAHFKTSSNQAPRHANPGQEGTEKWIWLRLKLIADAGLVGLPNAGKSTFLAAVSAAKPKIADYPFTTLHPNLGVVAVGERDFVLADIPGLIEGAHEGAGIGDRFLGHVERCAVLIHLIDGTQEDVKTAYKTIRGELAPYDEELAEKPEIAGAEQDRRPHRGRDQGQGEGAEARQQGRRDDGLGRHRRPEYSSFYIALFRRSIEAKAERAEAIRRQIDPTWSP